MGLDKQGKLAIIQSERGPLEHELFAAQTNLEVKEIGLKEKVTGVDQAQVDEAQARRDGIQKQIDLLDKRKAKVESEDDN